MTTAKKGLTAITAVYTSPEEKEYVKEIALKNRITQSEVFRLLLAAYEPTDAVHMPQKLI